MNPERWLAIGDLFEQALPLHAGAQTALVDRVCAADEEMRREVVSLLASHRAAPGGFFQERIRNALTSFHETSGGTHPARVGPYRLIRELGRGGMGTVFLAERDDQQYDACGDRGAAGHGHGVHRCALCSRERRALARLQHPSISGCSTAGPPMAVCRISSWNIDGLVTAYAYVNELSTDERLRIFLDVCAAVDYAHRQFIIHRDLKPGNILVGRDGVPKLLDFGICKLLRVDSISENDTGVAPMTPNYASPEQVRGDAVTLISDIYSLGAVLYELLTGKCPRQFGTLTPLGIEQASQTPIVLPSVAADAVLVARQLKGDGTIS